MRVALVAGEQSGDQLGAGLIQSMSELRPQLDIEAVGCTGMRNSGARIIADCGELSVMGLTEVIRELPRLLKLRRALLTRWLDQSPDVFVGIDAPDFNFELERRLRKHGVPVMHYVSPSVWAWRPGRVNRIRQSVDQMLVLFPFEEDFYRNSGIAVDYVGHPAASEITPADNLVHSREQLGLNGNRPTVAILPGSRRSEVSRLIDPFLSAAAWCLEREPDLQFVLPIANERVRPLIEEASRGFPDLPIVFVDGKARDAIDSADAVLVASGTATLECLLFQKPMVVAYRLAPITFRVVRHMLQTPWYSLANMLANEMLVPEITQQKVTAEHLGSELLALLNDSTRVERIKRRYAEIAEQLRRPSNHLAAEAVLSLAEKKS